MEAQENAGIDIRQVENPIQKNQYPDESITMRRFFHQMVLMKDLESDSEPVKTKKALVRYALEEWKAQLKTLDERLTQTKTESRNVKNEIYQLMSLFSVFAGVVLTAVSTSSRLECQHLWSPVGLCAFSYLLMIVITNMKFRTVWELDELRTFFLRRDRRLILRFLITVERKPFEDLNFQADIDTISERATTKGSSFMYFLLKQSLPLTFLLTIFTAGLVVSCVHILCWT